MVRILIFSILVSLLSGCFLKQNPPGPMDGPLTPTYQGIVAIDDRGGWDTPQGAFLAAFWKKQTPATKPSRALRLMAYSQKQARQEPECEYKTQVVSEKTETALEVAQSSPFRSDYISVGTLSFGPALQSSFDSVTPDEANAYSKKIRPGLPAGLFQITASGSTSVKKFGDYLSLPEGIVEASANGVPMSEGLPFLAKSQLRVQWRRPAIENDANFVLIDFVAKSGTTIHKISCSAEEGDLVAQEAFAHWTLPQEMVDQFPVTSAAALYVTRAHVRNAANSEVAIQFQGYRTMATPVVILTP